MPAPLSAARFLDVLKDEGLRVVEVDDWQTHHRNDKGPWGTVHGVMVHHTATSGADRTVRLCYDGRPDLPGPLCHGVITKDGTVHLVGGGRANHAGLGDGEVLRAVIAEKRLPPDNEADTDGNRHFYGFECENLGDGADPWPPAQIRHWRRPLPPCAGPTAGPSARSSGTWNGSRARATLAASPWTTCASGSPTD